MKANEIKLNKFLSQSDTHFVIPVYQRNYDWTLNQCKQLLFDVLNVGSEDKIPAHFIGSIVFIHDDEYSSADITELTIIDGQQRLTTVTLIYLVLYNVAKELKKESLVNKINEQYLINKFVGDDEEKLKLRPTENNDQALKFLLRGEKPEEFNEYSRVVENYSFFKHRISEENFETILKGLSKLMFVEISLNREKDDPQRIFESLNSTGLELSEADLIRNYILMGLSRPKQDKVYKNYWNSIEQKAKDETKNENRVSEFIRDYLTIKNKKIPNKNKVYQEFKENFSIGDFGELENTLEEIKIFSNFYNKLLNPKNEKDLDIQRHLKFINRLEINVSYPFLLQVYNDYERKEIDKNVFIEVLELVQSFTWRRFILGLGTNALNKIFMRMYEDIDKTNYFESLCMSLVIKKGSQRFPKDSELIATLKEKDVYNIKSKNRVYLLERLENYNNKEQVTIENNSNITIEHVFPQKPDVKWKMELEENEYTVLKETYLNTISNLTLSGNNGRLGNKVFLEKRDMNIDGHEQGYKFSRLWLNRFLSEQEKWGLSEIEKRFEILSERFLKVWKYPNVELSDEIDYTEVNIFDAEEPKGKKLAYAIFFEEKLEIKKISDLYKEIINQLFDLQPQTFFTTELGDRLGITKHKDDLRQALPINETYYIESNLDSNGKFDRIMKALEVFGFEDELIIKYEE